MKERAYFAEKATKARSDPTILGILDILGILGIFSLSDCNLSPPL